MNFIMANTVLIVVLSFIFIQVFTVGARNIAESEESDNFDTEIAETVALNKNVLRISSEKNSRSFIDSMDLPDSLGSDDFDYTSWEDFESETGGRHKRSVGNLPRRFQMYCWRNFCTHRYSCHTFVHLTWRKNCMICRYAVCSAKGINPLAAGK